MIFQSLRGLAQLSLSALILFALSTSGCSTVHSPPASSITKPAKVYVLHSTTHAALALPSPDGTYVQWGFGDAFYMNHSGVVKWAWGPALLLVGWLAPVTPGALERISLENRDQAGIAAETEMSAQLLIADESRVRELSNVLEAEFAQGVPVGDSGTLRRLGHYSIYYYACGNAMAGWCRQLDAPVSKWRLLPRWGPWEVKE